jgi:hypothetical protein
VVVYNPKTATTVIFWRPRLTVKGPGREKIHYSLDELMTVNDPTNLLSRLENSFLGDDLLLDKVSRILSKLQIANESFESFTGRISFLLRDAFTPSRDSHDALKDLVSKWHMAIVILLTRPEMRSGQDWANGQISQRPGQTGSR